MLHRLVSVYTLLYVLVSFIIGYPIGLIIWILTYPFDKKLQLLHLYTSIWGFSFLKINPFVKVNIVGKEKIKKGETYVIISNHQSLLDIVILFGIYKHFKWVAKKELFKVPVVGWMMALNNYIAVDRANKLSHFKMFEECENNLKSGNSIMIFPEGTRSEDAEIHTFKEGAFKIALSSGKPILPIVLDGTAAAIPKKGLFFKELSTISIRIFDPVPFHTFKHLSSKELATQSQEMFKRELTELRSKKI